MSMINAPTLTVALYPPGAGGKTVLNMLGLSKHATLQYSEFLSPYQKINLLDQRLAESKIKDVWDDLNLGCASFFGNNVHEVIASGKKLPTLKNFYLVNTCLVNRYHFFIVAHTTAVRTRITNYFGSTKTIFFKNAIKFLKHRNGRQKFLQIEYAKSRREHWPEKIPTVETMDQLPEVIKDEIQDTFFKGLYLESYDYLGDYVYDCMNLLNVDHFVESIKELYYYYGFDDFQLNEEFIRSYYTNWAEINLTYN